MSSLLRHALLLLGWPVLALGAAAAQLPSPGDLPRTAVVNVEVLETWAEPRSGSPTLGSLKRGESVKVIDADSTTRWLTIQAPKHAFAWIAQSTIRPEGPNEARVSASTAEIRAGIPGSNAPGPFRLELKRGDRVRLIDGPRRYQEQGRLKVTWLPIAPPEGDVRYIKAEGIAWNPPGRPPEPSEIQTSFEPAPPLEATGSLAEEIRAAESEHRAILSGPIESWRFDSLKARYNALRQRTTDPASRSAIDARLELVDRHEAMAKSARSFETILTRSRRRDLAVETTRKTLADLDRPGRRPFVAEGLIQPSSRQVDGRRVFALIGTEGSPIAYLDIPAGLDARPLVAKRVGVRGTVRFDEGLRSKLIAVRDLESLE